MSSISCKKRGTSETVWRRSDMNGTAINIQQPRWYVTVMGTNHTPMVHAEGDLQGVLCLPIELTDNPETGGGGTLP